MDKEIKAELTELSDQICYLASEICRDFSPGHDSAIRAAAQIIAAKQVANANNHIASILATKLMR